MSGSIFIDDIDDIRTISISRSYEYHYSTTLYYTENDEISTICLSVYDVKFVVYWKESKALYPDNTMHISRIVNYLEILKIPEDYEYSSETIHQVLCEKVYDMNIFGGANISLGYPQNFIKSDH